MEGRGAQVWGTGVDLTSSLPLYGLWKIQTFPPPTWGGADSINCITFQSAFI